MMGENGSWNQLEWLYAQDLWLKGKFTSFHFQKFQIVFRKCEKFSQIVQNSIIYQLFNIYNGPVNQYREIKGIF